jgi:hypothetical protein
MEPIPPLASYVPKKAWTQNFHLLSSTAGIKITVFWNVMSCSLVDG